MARLKLKRIIPDTGSNIDYDTGLSAANKLNDNSESIELFSEGLMPSDLVHRSGNEVIAGVKTFTSSPKAPEPVSQNDLATKRYVDNHSGGTGGDTVDMFKKGVTTIDNSDFFPPDEVQYPIYITPGSYGVSFVDPPIEEIPNENNFTLIVEYASSDGSGADGDQDYTHTLVSQSGRRFTRTGKHLPGAFHEVYLQWSNFDEVYASKAFLEENYVKKTIVEKITEYYRIEEDDDWFDIDAETKENVNIELAWNGTIAFDSPLVDDKSVLIQLRSLDLTQDYKVKLQVDGSILLDDNDNEVELGDGVTIFAIYSSEQDKWTVTWSTTQEEPVVEDYSDVAVKQMLTSGGQLVAPGNNKRLFFTGTSGLNVGDLFFYNYGSHYFTGLYRVFNSGGGTIVYADRIAERTTLRTVRVAGDGVYHNQFDGTNVSTVLFTKKDSLSDFNQDSTHRTVTDSQVNTWNGKQNALGYTPEQAGFAQSLIDSLKGGVSEEGDTLYKLYALIVSSFSEISVQDTAQRNAYNVTKLPTNIFVLNDGDSKWALYKCVSTGTNRVDDVKISDPDLLNAVMTASQIKTAYESNADTNAFTNAEKTKVGNTSGVNSGDETKSSIYSKLGITQYGGIISANLDTINENNKYTAYGTAIGVPSSSYSWFIDHQNSNVGTSAATQRAIAYSTTLIIYERVKQGGTWGSWIKQNVLSDDFIFTWNSKQSQLVSGENIKTINANSVLGSGNIELVIPSQLNSEQSARIAGDATLDEKINQVSSGYLGFISNSDAAPTPGKNGFYEFTDYSETGPMWLDVGPIYAADKVSVVYDLINLTYTYKLIPANVNYVSKGNAETITGEKTFSESPKVPAPGEDEDAVNKKYVGYPIKLGAEFMNFIKEPGILVEDSIKGIYFWTQGVNESPGYTGYTYYTSNYTFTADDPENYLPRKVFVKNARGGYHIYRSILIVNEDGVEVYKTNESGDFTALLYHGWRIQATCNEMYIEPLTYSISDEFKNKDAELFAKQVKTYSPTTNIIKRGDLSVIQFNDFDGFSFKKNAGIPDNYIAGFYVKIDYNNINDLNKELFIELNKLGVDGFTHAIILNDDADWGAGNSPVFLTSKLLHRNDGSVNLYNEISASEYLSDYNSRTSLYVLFGLFRGFDPALISDVDLNYNIKLYYGKSDVINLANGVTKKLFNELAGENADKIVCFGDSLTAGAGADKTNNKNTVLAKLDQLYIPIDNLDYPTFPATMQEIFGGKYDVVNCGVGGETINTIAARQGVSPILLPKQFLLPQIAGTTVEIADSVADTLKSSFDGVSVVLPLLQGSGNSVNPCYVDGIECTLSATWIDGVARHYLTRTSNGTRDVTIQAGTPLILSGAKLHRNPKAAILWCWQNGGYADDSDLISKLDKIISNLGTSNFIVIGLHTGNAEIRAEQEAALQSKYGSRFFNWRKYVSSNALYDFGITPTTDSDLTSEQIANGVKSDTYQMSVGALPSSLWRIVYGVDGEMANDWVHMNAAGYMILGYKLVELLRILGVN